MSNAAADEAADAETPFARHLRRITTNWAPEDDVCILLSRKNGNAPINKLPNEVMERIFDELAYKDCFDTPSKARCCLLQRKWLEPAKTALHRRMTVRSDLLAGNALDAMKPLQKLVKRCGEVRELALLCVELQISGCPFVRLTAPRKSWEP